jgi:hypothetical protein
VGESLEEKVAKVVEVVEERGLFKARKPEGKGGDH